MLPYLIAGAIKHTLWDSEGRSLVSLCLVSSNFTLASFSFADFTLYRYCVINLRREYDCRNRVSLPSASLDPRGKEYGDP